MLFLAGETIAQNPQILAGPDSESELRPCANAVSITSQIKTAFPEGPRASLLTPASSGFTPSPAPVVRAGQ
jgi:hypothetical protein